MRAAITTWGSRGDYQPYVALAVAFARAGHQVRLAAPPSPGFRELAAAHGVEFVPLGPAVDPEFMLETANAAIATSDPVRSVRFIMDRLLFPALDQMLAECLELARWSDVVVSHFFQVAGSMAAEIAGRPLVTGTLVATQLPTNRRPPGTMPHLARPLTGLLWKFVVWYMNAAWRGPINQARERAGLLPLRDVARDGFYSRDLNLVAMSPTVFPRPADWPARHRMTGYWLLDVPPGWTPPREVERFLAEGSPPVLVGFGSMTSDDAAALTRTVLQAVSAAGVRAIIEPGLARLGGNDLPPGVLVADDVPHAWLLPRAAALVHHGGAGTTAAAFHAGIPSVVVPHVFDQEVWAKQAAKLGVAPDPVPLRKLTADRLAEAIRQASSDARLKQRARQLAGTLARERGADNAVSLVEDYVRTRGALPAGKA